MICNLPVSTRFGLTFGMVTVAKCAQCVQVSEKYSMAVTGALGEPMERWLKGENAVSSAKAGTARVGAMREAPTRDSVLRRDISMFSPTYSVNEFLAASRIVFIAPY